VERDHSREALLRSGRRRVPPHRLLEVAVVACETLAERETIPRCARSFRMMAGSCSVRSGAGGGRSGGVCWSRRCGTALRCDRWLARMTSVSPPCSGGSDGRDSFPWTTSIETTTTLSSRRDVVELNRRYRISWWSCGANSRTRVTWVSMEPELSIANSPLVGTGVCQRLGPSAASSSAAAPWMLGVSFARTPSDFLDGCSSTLPIVWAP
jgi:hypothetical protein